MLEIDKLEFEYLKNQPILNDISFKVSQGQLCGLFGPNGCGKTTLFKCCLKFLNFKKGSISVDETNINRLSIREMAKLVAYVPQEHKPSFPYLVRDVVLMGRTPHLKGVFNVSKEDKQKTVDAMKLVGIDSISMIPYNQLSGGQRQLVIIARAVAQESKILFLDEPTSALDFSNQIRVWKLLRKICHSGTTIIACTHDPNHVMWFCDQVVVMGDNRIISTGPPEKIITESVLDEIYSKICSIKDLEQTKMVYPRDLAKIKNNSKNRGS